ncbi:MAG: WG repeat-containing protein [Bacteroidetes bacterium]|nr:WG repeat-containing protein [Bacteroidota bacterium]
MILRTRTVTDTLWQISYKPEAANIYNEARTDGKIISPCLYESVGRFSGGKAQVTKGGKTYYIDKEGRCVKDCP